jgi:glyoxylase-like metal-dependent hydrolase (beta-lactamase superfamily II)
MYAEGLDDVLGDYLGSLQKLLDMGIATTYPAHGAIIERGDERARQILLHHDRRLLDMAELVREGSSDAWQVMRKSFRPSLTALEARLAFLETIAHLEHLRSTGKVRAEERDGRITYSA